MLIPIFQRSFVVRSPPMGLLNSNFKKIRTGLGYSVPNDGTLLHSATTMGGANEELWGLDYVDVQGNGWEEITPLFAIDEVCFFILD